MGSTPRKQPGFHIVMGDVMPGLDLPIRLADFLLLAIFHRSRSDSERLRGLRLLTAGGRFKNGCLTD